MVYWYLMIWGGLPSRMNLAAFCYRATTLRKKIQKHKAALSDVYQPNSQNHLFGVDGRVVHQRLKLAVSAGAG